MRFVRLAALATLSALVTSRVTLVVHELLGHAAVARAMGAEITDLGLFLFAGGWIRFTHGPWSAAQVLAATLGGLALELVIGGAALLVARRPAPGSPARFALTAFGAIDLVHACFYLATGAHHGYGDGFVVHHLLGTARPWLVIPASLITVGVAFFVARRLAEEAEPWLAGRTRGRRLASLLAAALAAAAIHGGLALAESRLDPQAPYQAVKETQSERDVARELAAWREAAVRRGEPLDAQAMSRARARFEAEHRSFPLLVVLGIGVALACALGAWRADARRREARARDVPRALAPLVLACALSLALVASLKLLR